MKKTYLLTACAAVLAVTACTDNEYIGEVENPQGKYAEINFGGKSVAATRADITGGPAAELLGTNFVVEGIKGDGSSQTVVFDHYNVNYYLSSAGKTDSNTKDWEYVGETPHSLSSASAQTIKFWDFAASQYDFVAFSYGTAADKTNTSDPVFSKVSYNNLGKAVNSGTPVYTVLGRAEELAKTYIADLVTLYNRNGVSEFGKSEVTPRFRSLGTKVRLAFYETVPGYAVENVKFYSEEWDGNVTTALGVENATLFAASGVFPSAGTAGTMSVYYPTVGWAKSGNDTNPKDADYNQARVVFTAGTGSQALATTKTFGTVNYKSYTENTLSFAALGTTSNDASYAGSSTDNYYQIVLPLGTSDNLQIRIEYDLVSTDGSGEVIHVRDARAVVPAAYANWKPNYAYTYIFKISDNTNGWTGVDGDGNVVEGLTPITFDAVVVKTEDGVQETITTVSTPSITTYQEGKVVTAGSEYQAGDVYASVMNSTTAVDLSSLTAPAGVAVYTATTTNTVEGISEATVTSKLMGNDNGITLASCGYEIVSEVPAADGNTLAVSACKFAVASGKTYVFMYTDGSKNYVKVIKVQ